MRNERYETKRLPANQNLAFIGAKRGTGSKSLVLTAKDILAPNYDFMDDELLLKKGSLDEQEAKAKILECLIIACKNLDLNKTE